MQLQGKDNGYYYSQILGLQSSQSYYKYGKAGDPAEKDNIKLGLISSFEDFGTFKYFQMFTWLGFWHYLVELHKTRFTYLFAPYLPGLIYTYRIMNGYYD